MKPNTKPLTYLKFLRIVPTKLPDGTIRDYIYRGSDGKEHVGLREIERENSNGVLEGIMIIGDHKVIEKIEILTDRLYSLKRAFKTKHLEAMGEASEAYHTLCKQSGF
ncbi:MAG: hypothetical protein KKE23_04225 [Nanoarchaeota archaeon]|nr:hypothetical protein [Nanoarchaeota archaeon]